MRNEQYTLDEELPVEIRLSVYKKALDYYISVKNGGDNKYDLIGEGGGGVCLVLPCILWELDSFLSEDPKGNDWDYSDVKIAFPEIKEWVSNYKESEDKLNDRINCLKLYISELEPF